MILQVNSSTMMHAACNRLTVWSVEELISWLFRYLTYSIIGLSDASASLQNRGPGISETAAVKSKALWSNRAWRILAGPGGAYSGRAASQRAGWRSKERLWINVVRTFGITYQKMQLAVNQELITIPIPCLLPWWVSQSRIQNNG